MIAIVPAVIIMVRLEQRAIEEGRRLGHAPPPGPAANRREIGISFWRYAGPRAAGQLSEIMISWLDTVLVGAIISTSAAGIYGAGTRLMLPGLFVGEAVMQVVGPKVSAMLIRSEVRDAGSAGPDRHRVAGVDPVAHLPAGRRLRADDAEGVRPRGRRRRPVPCGPCRSRS